MVSPEEVQAYLAQGLPCEHLSVEGDGHHFYALIVSPAFAGLNRIQRQQVVYKAMAGRIESGEVHALSMRTFTPEEWKDQRG